MKYAVIRLQGHQYKVSEGDEILVDKITGEVAPETLLVVDGDEVKVGAPVLDSKVTVKVLSEEKGEKIRGYKFRAKSRYHKSWGHRSQLTRLSVEKIAA